MSSCLFVICVCLSLSIVTHSSSELSEQDLIEQIRALKTEEFDLENIMSLLLDKSFGSHSIHSYIASSETLTFSNQSHNELAFLDLLLSESLQSIVWNDTTEFEFIKFLKPLSLITTNPFQFYSKMLQIYDRSSNIQKNGITSNTNIIVSDLFKKCIELKQSLNANQILTQFGDKIPLSHLRDLISLYVIQQQHEMISYWIQWAWIDHHVMLWECMKQTLPLLSSENAINLLINILKELYDRNYFLCALSFGDLIKYHPIINDNVTVISICDKIKLGSIYMIIKHYHKNDSQIQVIERNIFIFLKYYIDLNDMEYVSNLLVCSIGNEESLLFVIKCSLDLILIHNQLSFNERREKLYLLINQLFINDKSNWDFILRIIRETGGRIPIEHNIDIIHKIVSDLSEKAKNENNNHLFHKLAFALNGASDTLKLIG
eukprot:42971_1